MSLVSVVMPMRNTEAYIRESIRSVLDEHDVPLEVVVVNDGSTDGSAEIVQSINDDRVRMIDGPVQGIASCVNAGLETARGDIFMRCDSDDTFAAGRVAQQSRWLEKHHDFGAVCGSFHTVDAGGRLAAELETGNAAEEITAELRAGTTRTHLGTFAVRTEVVRRLQGCRSYFSGVEDIDLQLRIGTVSRVWYEPQLVYLYRIHCASSTHTQRSPQRIFLTGMARHFARQRHEEGTDDLERGCAPAPPANDEGDAASANEHVQYMLIGQAWREHGRGQQFTAVRTGLRAVTTRPTCVGAWKSLLALCLKPTAASTDKTGQVSDAD